MHVLILWQSGGDSTAERAGRAGASVVSNNTGSPAKAAQENARVRDQDRPRKKQRRKGTQDQPTGTARLLKENAHRINWEFIPSALAMLGPDMHEGGAAKTARDKLYFQVVSALDIPGSRGLSVSERDAVDVEGRLKLIATNLQTVDQVSCHIALEILSCSDVMTRRPFCSTCGWYSERASTKCLIQVSCMTTASIRISLPPWGFRQQALESVSSSSVHNTRSAKVFREHLCSVQRALTLQNQSHRCMS
jgi:hypothetical protein